MFLSNTNKQVIRVTLYFFGFHFFSLPYDEVTDRCSFHEMWEIIIVPPKGCIMYVNIGGEGVKGDN